MFCPSLCHSPSCNAHWQEASRGTLTAGTGEQTRRERFEQTLKEHQRATGADGLTVLRRAVIEHNVIAASKVYTNIRFSELGALLEVPAEQAEGIVAKMVVTGRLEGSIDQINGVLEFGSGADPVCRRIVPRGPTACSGRSCPLAGPVPVDGKHAGPLWEEWKVPVCIPSNGTGNLIKTVSQRRRMHSLS